MKCIVLIVLLSCNTASMATAVDSTSPLRNPFVIKVHVAGLFQDDYSTPYGGSNSSGKYQSAFDLSDSIDFRDTVNTDAYHYQNRVLTHIAYWNDFHQKSSKIVFDSIPGRILSIITESREVQPPQFSGGSWSMQSNSVELKNLIYDSTSFFTSDSDLNNHLVNVHSQYSAGSDG